MFLFSVISVVVFVLLAGLVTTRLYKRARQDRAFVRTGLGGKKVVISGGALVLPVFQEIVWVGTKTVKLQVTRAGDDSLITADRLRVDVSAEFYIKVGSTEEAVAAAAQSLGDKTENPTELNKLVEGKLVDALRSAASSMNLSHLHEQRPQFIKVVKDALTDDLAKNGLELESVSLTSLNQTEVIYFKENNVFDAEGLLLLTNSTQASLKARNEIEQNTAVAMAQKNLEATVQQQAIEKQTQDAILTTKQEIEQKAADTNAKIKKTAAEKNLEAAEVEIQAQQKIDTQQLDAKAAVLSREQEIIKSTQAVDTQKIESKTAVAAREQEAQIVIAKKASEVAEANTIANAKLADEIRSQEAITTTREVAIANRNKEVALVAAEELARQSAIQTTTAAEATRDAAKYQAEAAELVAKGEKNAALLKADSIEALGNAEAASLRARNEATNTLSPALIEQQVKLQLLAQLPSIIAESVKPMEKIESIRIAEVGGLNGASSVTAGGSAYSAGNGASLGTEVVNSALRYQAVKPLVAGLMGSVGLSAEGLDQMISSAVTSTAGSFYSNAATEQASDAPLTPAASSPTVATSK